MRLFIAGIAALAAVSFATPSFAQDAVAAPDPAATPTPKTKSKPKTPTAAYCNSLESSTQRSSCLKRVQTAKASHTTTKTKKPAPAPTNTDTSAQAPASTMSAPSNSTVAVPPLPQKTI